MSKTRFEEFGERVNESIRHHDEYVKECADRAKALVQGIRDHLGWPEHLLKDLTDEVRTVRALDTDGYYPMRFRIRYPDTQDQATHLELTFDWKICREREHWRLTGKGVPSQLTYLTVESAAGLGDFILKELGSGVASRYCENRWWTQARQESNESVPDTN